MSFADTYVSDREHMKVLLGTESEYQHKKRLVLLFESAVAEEI